MSRSPSRRDPQAGTGLVSSMVGLIVFWAFLLMAVQALASLYARSTVSAAGFQAARTVASRQVDHRDRAEVEAAKARAEATFRRLVGPLADAADLRWTLESGVVRLHVAVDSPAFLPRVFATGTGTRSIEREFVVRVEGLS